MLAFTRVASATMLLVVDDIDTDQIIPARFLKTTQRLGLGTHLFADWRYAADGSTRADFPLNAPNASERRILVAGRNFGCGSSREHAPWALSDFGLRAIVAPSFADIFRGNALKNGLLPVSLDATAHATLVRHLMAHPDATMEVDVSRCRVAVDHLQWSFPLAPFARHCLLHGIDQMGYLLSAEPEISAYERHHPPRVDTREVATVSPALPPLHHTP